MEQLNFFNLLDEIGEEEEKVVEVPKKASKSAAGKGKTATKKVVGLTYKLPVKVLYLPGVTVEIQGEGDITAEELIKKAAEQIPALKVYSAFIKDGDSYIPAAPSHCFMAKGQTDLKEMTVYGPDFREVNLSGLHEKKEDISKLIEACRADLPEELRKVPMTMVAKEKTAQLLFSYESNKELEETVPEPGEEYVAVLATGAEVKITEEDPLCNGAAEKFGMVADNLKLYDLGNKRFLVTMEQEKKLTTAEVKETTYPVEGYTLSLLFKEYAISPEDFGGKKEVKKEDITNYLIAKGHRDYGIAQYTIDKFEKEKLLICTMQGSKKGSSEHPLFRKSPENKAVLEEGVNRIPVEAIDFFTSMAKRQVEKEMMLELFYEPGSGKYIFLYPVQKQTVVSVDAHYDGFFENQRLSGLIKVGEFHSHGRLYAGFSSIDDADEAYKPGLYGVVGTLDKHPSYAFRYSFGNGQFDEIGQYDFAKQFSEWNARNFVNDDAYMECLTESINAQPLRFAVEGECGWYLNIGRHEVHTLSAVPGLELAMIDVGCELCPAARLKGRTVKLEAPYAEGFMEMYLNSERNGVDGEKELAC